MIRILYVALACALSAPAAAQQVFPALYDVAGVALDDRLSLRAGPGVENRIVGVLRPDATGLEVVGTNEAGTWGLVARREDAGWASLRFLERQPGWDDPDPLAGGPIRCGGTEPFWSAQLGEPGRVVFESPMTAPVAYEINAYAQPATNRTIGSFEGTGEAGPILGVVRRAQCSDGMSDRVYGLQIDFFPRVVGGLQHLSGCCRLD